MNFFEHQDQARRNTQRLVGLFILSLLTIIVSIYVAAIATFGQGGACVQTIRSALPEPSPTYVEMKSRGAKGVSKLFGSGSRSRGSGISGFSSDRSRTGTSSLGVTPSYRASNCVSKRFVWWSPQLLFWTSTLTLLVIGGASWYKVSTLQSGGAAIAQDLGGRLLVLEMADPQEQQLLNVVAEMAIASGISVPAVYLLDNEPEINAFAAGYTINDAVIGVTRGSLEQLTRDELQGVIGHEFSHILNGDMRLNIQLVSVIHGLLFVYLAGRVIWEARDRGKFSQFGFALIVIGSVGVFFGRLIKSAISRQREFLADASAVQFTRNPDGIAGALEKIGGIGSQVRSPKAEAASHMFFGNALKVSWLEDLHATHPPLPKRIQRIRGSSVQFESAPPQSFNGDSGVMGFAAGTSTPVPKNVVAQVGTVTPAHYAHAQGLLAQLPDALRAGVRERQSAIAILYALMLDPQNQSGRAQQLEFLRQVEFADVVDQTVQFSTHLDQSDPRVRLPLVDLTVPVLRQGTAEENQKLFKCLHGVAKADGNWSLSEFVVYLVLNHRLNPPADKAVEYGALTSVWSDCLNLLSALARVGETRADAILYAFRSGVFRLPDATAQEIPETPPVCHLGNLRTSLERLRNASPKIKQAIVDACAHTVLLDNTVTIQEADLLRAIVITLDCPIPPFLNATSTRSKKTSKST